MTTRKKGLVAKTIEIFSVTRGRGKKNQEATTQAAEDALQNYLDRKTGPDYQHTGFSGLSDALDHIADRPRK